MAAERSSCRFSMISRTSGSTSPKAITFRNRRRSCSQIKQMSLRRGHPADYLLSGVVRCGLCGRAFIGTSAKGRSKLYHYYTCSTRYRYGTRSCGADRLPKDELEEAVLEQMIDIYRDSDLLADALEQLQSSEREERETAETKVATLRQEQAGVRRRWIGTSPRSRPGR
jgi:hypothetical protein